MTRRYDQLLWLIDNIKPKTIIEVGTHRGNRALLMCHFALQHRNVVHYTGFDLFEDATPETDRIEMNGKGRCTMDEVRQKLDRLKMRDPDFVYELRKGNTRETLHGLELAADFVFIDGGHSVETIRGDYEALKGSKCIVFDDYYTHHIDTTKFGCNSIVAGFPHEVLPALDAVKGGGYVQMVLRR